MIRKSFVIILTLGLILGGAWQLVFAEHLSVFVKNWLSSYQPSTPEEYDQKFFQKLSEAAKERATKTVRYDGAYLTIPYPNGDVPADMGVCTDEVIRSYRQLGIDLQQLVHEDMKKNFSKYPKLWRLTSPDSNIDHRRVPNLMVFFARHGKLLSITNDPKAYLPGDLVAWELPNKLLHIGIVVDQKSADKRRNLILHNIGAGPQIEDALHVGKIIGHFRYQ